MTIKTKIIIAVAYSVGLVALGAYLVPTKVVTKVQTVEVEKKTSKDDTKITQKKHRTATIITVKKPDGESTTTTTITDDTGIDKDTKSIDTVVDNKDTKSEKTVEKTGGNVTISALAGVNPFNPGNGIAYGGLIQRDLIGPINFGLFGMSNGMFGLSLGLKF